MYRENFQPIKSGPSCAIWHRGEADSGMIGVVVRSLEDASPKVRARALGTVHNLSTDTSSIGIIRQEVWDLRLLSASLRSVDRIGRFLCKYNVS